MTDALTELSATVAKLATVDERRSSLIEYRDRQIIAALEKGATWVRLQELTGLSVRGLKLAVDRAHKATGGKPKPAP